MTRPLDVARWPPWLQDRTGSVASAESSSSAVTFPTTPLSGKVYLAIGADLTRPPTSWSWTDISNYVRFTSGISTRQGRADEQSTVSTSAGQLTLDNRDGRFSRRNPNSPYFGSLTFNTPIWATVDPGSGPITRMQMFVNEWPTRWDRSATDSTVPIQCAGIMRRLQQGTVLKSAMRRRVLSPNEPTPAAYWPCEDGSNATTVVSGLPGGRPMVGFVADSGTVGHPEFGSGFGGSTGSLNLLAAPDGEGVSAPVTLASASGFQAEFMIISNFGATVDLVLEFDCGTLSLNIGIGPTTADGSPHHVAVRFVQNGPNVDVTGYRDGVAGATTPVAATLSTSLAISTRNPSQGTDLRLAHLVVYDFASMNVPTTRAPAATAYAGELATTRIRRLAAEEGVPMLCTSGLSPAMGPQPVDTFLNILRDCEKVDQGVLYETNWGLGYQSCNDRTNQPVSLALDKTQRHIAVEPEPADDDQRLRNRWTVSRSDGSQYTKELTSGPLGTQAGGPGLYDDSITVNVNLDTQLVDQAGWRLHFGIDDEDRWPSIAIRLHGTPTLIPSWAVMPFGARMTFANPPSQMAPDLIDAIVEGWAERWDTKSWDAVLATSPYSPYLIGTLAIDTGDTGSTLLILTPDTLTLATAVDTTATSWSVNSSPVWTTNSEMFPRRILWEGEEIRLTNCSGASAPQTWTVVRSVNGIVKAHSAGSSGHLIHPGVLALA
jgi:hypothetical protein